MMNIMNNLNVEMNLEDVLGSLKCDKCGGSVTPIGCETRSTNEGTKFSIHLLCSSTVCKTEKEIEVE